MRDHVHIRLPSGAIVNCDPGITQAGLEAINKMVEIAKRRLNMKNPKSVSTVGPENFWAYEVPQYKITNLGVEDVDPLILCLARGSKDDDSKPRQEGVFTESLLEVCRIYLNSQNAGEMATRETAMAITKIEEALMWIQKRADDRKMRNVQTTYQK